MIEGSGDGILVSRNTMNQLRDKGMIFDLKGKAKLVVLSEDEQRLVAAVFVMNPYLSGRHHSCRRVVLS